MSKIIAIVGHARSGTTWIHDLIGSHSNVVRGGERVSPTMYGDPDPQSWGKAKVNSLKFRGVCNDGLDAKDEGDYYIFNYHFMHANKDVDKYLIKENAKIIIVERNPIDVELSGLLVRRSMQNKDYRTHDDCHRKPYKTYGLQPNPSHLKQFIDNYLNLLGEAYERFIVSYAVPYEVMIEQIERYKKQLLEFIGLPFEELTSRYKKQRNKKQSEVMKNYVEIKNYFNKQGQRYPQYLTG